MNTARAYIWSGEGLLAQTGISSSGPNSGGGGPPPEETRYAHTDHLGTIKMLSNSAGEAVAGSNYSYTPFGDLAPPHPAAPLFRCSMPTVT